MPHTECKRVELHGRAGCKIEPLMRLRNACIFSHQKPSRLLGTSESQAETRPGAEPLYMKCSISTVVVLVQIRVPWRKKNQQSRSSRFISMAEVVPFDNFTLSTIHFAHKRERTVQSQNLQTGRRYQLKKIIKY